MIKSKKVNTGLHIIGDIFTKDKKKLKSYNFFRKKISKVIKNNNLKKLGSIYHNFSDSGFTGIVSLAESHVAIHTWPEFDYLTLDVYICNYSKDNSKICRKVFEELSADFKPFKVKKRLIKR